MDRLANKTIVITGGNSGIGKATAKRFAQEGARLVICARRAGLLDEAAREIRAEGGIVQALPADVSDPAQAQRVIDACVETYGGLDAVVNCHGVQSKIITFLDRCDDDTWDYVMGNNARGAFNMMRAALRYMVPHGGGGIVNIASVAGEKGCGDGVYVASKGAIIAMTKHVAMNYASKHIRCNAICPGGVKTPMTEPNSRGEGLDFELIGEMKKHGDMALGYATAEQIANINLFFASDESINVNGEIFVADFGYAL